MKAFTSATVTLILLIGLCTANDAVCYRACVRVEDAVKSGEAESAAEALAEFKRVEWLFGLSVDTGYVSEARVSLESLIAAHRHGDSYETERYIRDTCQRVRRIRRSLFI